MTDPIWRVLGTGLSCAGAAGASRQTHEPSTELSQNLRHDLLYSIRAGKQKPPPERGLDSVIRANPRDPWLTSWPFRPWRTCGGSAPRGRRYPSASACR